MLLKNMNEVFTPILSGDILSRQHQDVLNLCNMKLHCTWLTALLLQLLTLNMRVSKSFGQVGIFFYWIDV